MVRLLGKIVMVLLVASCGAIVTKVFTDVKDQLPAQLLNSEIYKEVRLKPVRLKDFRKQLAATKNYYDLLRIFFDRKSISNKEIDELLNARTIKKSRIPDHVQLREFSESEDYTDEYQDYGDYALQDPGSSVMDDIHRAYAHYEEMEKNPLGHCHDPQPEIMPVRGEGESKHKLYIPECTVIHRCRNVSGCCGNASTVCGPKTIEIVSKAFIVIQPIGFDEVQPDDVQMVENRDFINHTECECQEIKGLPGCNKQCPVPFTRMRPDLKCTCDCLEDNDACLEIKYGHKALDEKMLMKIKDNTHMVPECGIDKFNIKTGYCPRRRHSGRSKSRKSKTRGQSRHQNRRKHHRDKNISVLPK